ncbi:hypothetical protein EVAR_94815_1 [Eumeta japonica]|uniref:Reverse transcriptase domain-containing protein n=1 Tax=Eumeta variegata TaxID=151549 RepID=A0A4C1UIM9_EUMVA|nr:hypothetical protein EVAR_94815_1 [Eumeta japonica]
MSVDYGRMSCLSNVLYADDQVILAPSACGLQKMVNRMNDSVSKGRKHDRMRYTYRRINAVEMRSLRIMCGVPRKDSCKNSDVRERCGLKEDVMTRVEGGMLRCFGHPVRMNESKLTKQIYKSNVCDGRVSEGRPRKFYADHIGGILKMPNFKHL